jgi:hypothetical protein
MSKSINEATLEVLCAMYECGYEFVIEDGKVTDVIEQD